MLESLTLGEVANLSFPVLALVLTYILLMKAGKGMAALFDQYFEFYTTVLVPNKQAYEREQAEAQKAVGEGLVRVGAALDHMEISFAREFAGLRDDVQEGFAAMREQLLEMYRLIATMGAGGVELALASDGGPKEGEDNKRVSEPPGAGKKEREKEG